MGLAIDHAGEPRADWVLTAFDTGKIWSSLAISPLQSA
jgi:hypothetical protein